MQEVFGGSHIGHITGGLYLGKVSSISHLQVLVGINYKGHMSE